MKGKKEAVEDLKISVYITAYNKGNFLGEAIQDLLNQTFKNFEIIISDNNSTDNTEDVVKGFKDKRIKYFKNVPDVGYVKNLQLAKERTSGDIIYLHSGRNRISKYALERTYNAFKLSDNIGAVTRPYYWFGKDIYDPVRAKERFCGQKDAVVSIKDAPERVMRVFNYLDNPAGLAFRKKYMKKTFSSDPFVEFTYPFAWIMKEHDIVVLKDYVMACAAFKGSGSQKPVAYEKSPVQNWVDMFNNVFSEDEFKEIRDYCIKNFVAVNYIGLVQIKNYAAKYSYLIREILLMVKYRWQNLFNIKFWFFSLGTMIIPRTFLIPLVTAYKKKVNSKLLKCKEIILEV